MATANRIIEIVPKDLLRILDDIDKRFPRSFRLSKEQKIQREHLKGWLTRARGLILECIGWLAKGQSGGLVKVKEAVKVPRYEYERLEKQLETLLDNVGPGLRYDVPSKLPSVTVYDHTPPPQEDMGPKLWEGVLTYRMIELSNAAWRARGRWLRNGGAYWVQGYLNFMVYFRFDALQRQILIAGDGRWEGMSTFDQIVVSCSLYACTQYNVQHSVEEIRSSFLRKAQAARLAMGLRNLPHPFGRFLLEAGFAGVPSYSGRQVIHNLTQHSLRKESLYFPTRR